METFAVYTAQTDFPSQAYPQHVGRDWRTKEAMTAGG